MKTDKNRKSQRHFWRTIPEVEHYVHLVYFGLVFLQGPYQYMAGVCVVLGVVVLWVQHR